MLTLIDNFDSFTHNLVHAFMALGASVQVVRYDELRQNSFDNTKLLVVGPGPGTPSDVPLCQKLIRELELPILGICLGHQCIASCFGGSVVRANYPMHGKKSAIHHDGCGLFEGVTSPLFVGRYHSLVVQAPRLPECLQIDALTESGEVMALSHKTRPIWGLQFHPESILTPQGEKLLNNFLIKEKSYEKVHSMPPQPAL